MAADLARTFRPHLARLGALNLAPERRRQLWIAAEIALLAAFVILRSAGAAGWTPAWTALAVLLALLSPVSGLVLVGALAALPDGHRVAPGETLPTPGAFLGAGYRVELVIATGFGILLRGGRPVGLAPRLALALVVWATVGLVIAAVTLEGIKVPQARGWLTFASTWAILPMAAWAAASGQLRPLIATLVGHGAAVIVTLTAFAASSLFRDLPLAWLSVRPHSLRAPGTIGSPNGLAASMGIMAAASFALLLRGWTFPERWRRPLLVLSGLLFAGASGAVLLTFSRSGALALVAAIAALLLLQGRRRVFLIGAGIAAVIVPIVIVLFINARLVQDIDRGLQGISANDAQRNASIVAALRMGADRPLTGFGIRSFGEFRVEYGSLEARGVHNDPARVFGELGAPGLLLWGGTWAAALVTMWRRRRDGFMPLAGVGAAVVLLGVGMAQPLLSYRPVLISALMLVGYGVAWRAGLVGPVPSPSDEQPGLHDKEPASG